jgi:hypothetical protein
MDKNSEIVSPETNNEMNTSEKTKEKKMRTSNITWKMEIQKEINERNNDIIDEQLTNILYITYNNTFHFNLWKAIMNL